MKAKINILSDKPDYEDYTSNIAILTEDDKKEFNLSNNGCCCSKKNNCNKKFNCKNKCCGRK